MRNLSARLTWPLVLLAMLVMAGAPAYGQGNTTTLSGVVTDDQGGVVPGADVTAKNNATNATMQGVTDGTGRFVLAGVAPGTYTVTVTLMGFKTAVLPDISVVTGTPASIKVALKVGTLEETVVVTGQTEVLQATSPTLSSTIAVKQIQQLPVISHTALDFAVSLPGVETSGLGFRASTINGLPVSAINITLDGINVQDKRSTTEGMFMYIRPMMDSVEEVTVATSNSDAASTGVGAANIRMETRSGSNRFTGSVYNTWRNQAGTNANDVVARKEHPGWLWGLNTPYWFDTRDRAKTAAGDYFQQDVRVTTPGFRVGGPIVKDKLFYFFNYEEFRYPGTQARTRYVLNPQAQFGNFTYLGTDGVNHTINLLTDIAAKFGQTATTDPAIAKLLADIRTATGDAAAGGSVTTYDLNTDTYNYAPMATQKRAFPTVRADYNITNAHRLSFTYRYNKFDSTPDQLNGAEPKFPGFPNYGSQVSGRYMWQVNLRSTLGKSMVNEFRIGHADATGAGTYFGKDVAPGMFNCSGAGCQVSGGVGYIWGFPTTTAGFSVNLTSATAYPQKTASVAPNQTYEDTLTWLKGKHSLSIGGTFAQTKERYSGEYPVQTSLTFGLNSNDPAYNYFVYNSGNYPGGISSTQATYAQLLYSFLTGRITGITSTYNIQPDGSYVANSPYEYRLHMNDFGAYASDSWRVKPNLTLTLGVRYQLQLPPTADSLYTKPQSWQQIYGITGAGSGLYGSGNLYQGGRVATGTNPVVVRYATGSNPYNVDYNNVAPNIGAAWRPALKDGVLSKILGKDPVLRGGYAISYTKLGLSFFDSVYYYNPGASRTGSRTATSGTPTIGYDGWPLLMRDGSSRIFPATAPAPLTGDFSLTPAVNESVRNHYPDWPTPSTQQYSASFQRELGKAMALDIRYVGNTNVGGWTNWNINGSAQWSMMKGENGFYDEFRLAQKNLQANIAAGKGNTFAYTGVPGTAPLPIFMGYLQGVPLTSADNQDPTKYTASQFTSSSWYNQLAMYAPNLTGIAGTGTNGLQNGIGAGTGLDANRIKAGIPANFFIANPAVGQGSAYIAGHSGNSRYNALQIELRRRMSGGFLISANYTYAFGRKTWTQRSLREDWFYIDSTGSPDHAFKANWVYELPFGRGKKFGSGVSAVVDGFIGGWEIDGVARVQSGTKANFGGYRLVGMSEDEFAGMFKYYHVVDPATLDSNGKPMDRIYMLPQDVIANSILALNTTSATSATGYSGALPTGKYLAPASGPDCVQYWSGMCPGTAVTRIVTGPIFWKVDMSFVKRIPVWKNVRVEARMDLYNVFNTINYLSNFAVGSSTSVTAWQVTAAASDTSNSQDPGGRMSQFGLRVTW
jgi:hypothetical protein